jgi:2-iminobutanoate/2-iminopropanoate deaminase
MKRVINPPGLAVPAACYSQLVQVGDLVFLAGAVGQDAERRLVGDDVASQTRQALRNMETALAAVGGTLADVCSVTAFLEHIDRDFAAYDAAYAEVFAAEPPARATVQAHIAGEGVLVEIQAIAVLGNASTARA